jgi:hypothetical protein
MTLAERKASDAAYRKRVSTGAFSVPPYARKSMHLETREES